MRNLVINTQLMDDKPNADWQEITNIIIDLPHSEHVFITLSNVDVEYDYIQMTIDDLDKMIYMMEIRVSQMDDNFQHYRLYTKDVASIMLDFENFYNGETVDISKYEDVTKELLLDLEEKTRIETALNEFINRNKFADDVWLSRGLTPSKKECSDFNNAFLNKVANELITSVVEGYEDFDSVIIHYLDTLKVLEYDSEEREFVFSYFTELADICEVEINEKLQKV